MRLKSLLVATVILVAAVATNAQDLVGTWKLVKESDGTTPKAGAIVKLTLSAGGALALSAVQPGEVFEDSGSWSTIGTRITMHFDQMDKGCTSQPFTLSGNTLTLPVRVLNDGPGTSSWVSEVGSGTTTKPTTAAPAGPIGPVLAQTLEEARQQDNAEPRRKMDFSAAQDAPQFKDGLAESYYAQGVGFFLRGYLYEAWYGFAKAASLSPTNALYLNNLAMVLTKLDRDDNAVSILDWVTRTFPMLDAPFGNLGIAQMKQGSCDLAKKSLERAIQLDPENGMYEYALGKALVCLGRKEEAKRYYAAAWNHGYSGDDGGGDETGGSDEGGTGTGTGGTGTGTGSGTGTGTGGVGGHGGKPAPGQGAPGRPTPTRPQPHDQGRDGEKGFPPEWVGHYEAKYVRARSGETGREANTQFGQGMTGTNINLQTLACAKEFSMEISSDGSIHGRGKILYVYQGKAINPAMMLMPAFAVVGQGGFACNLKGGYQLRDWNFSGKVDPDGNVEIEGLPSEKLDLLNVGKWEKISTWSPMPCDDKAHMRGPFHMTLATEENNQPAIHVDQWLDLGDKLIRRVHYQARILKTDDRLTPDCKYEAPKKPKCPAREYLKSKIKYAPKNGVTVEVSKDLGTGEMSSKTGAKGSFEGGSVEGSMDSKGNMQLEGAYGSATGSVKVNINDGSYQVSAGVGIDTGKLTPKGFPGKIKEKLELTYDSKCGWGIKGTIGGEAFGASASIEGCVFLTAGP